MIKTITLVCLILFSVTVSSQNIAITGIAPGKIDELVRIIVYSDQFSNVEHTIASTKTNKLGEFTLKFWVDKTQFAFLALGLEKGEFYLSPGSTYNFVVHTDTTTKLGSIFDQLPLSFDIDADDNGIQNAIGDFNVTYNDFIYNNVNSIYKSRDKSVVTKFVADMHDKYSNNNSEYVKNYVQYSLVSLLWLSRKESNAKVLEKYIVNMPVLYNNIQYTVFFKEFFKSYYNTEKSFTYSDLMYAINNTDVEEFTNLLTRNNHLASDNRVLEIVEMLVLSRNYHNRDVHKDKVMDKLKIIAKQSQYIENKKIADNFIVELNAMQNGSPAPFISVLNSSLDTITLNTFKGKFVLLSFVKDDCKICKFQMQLINDIRKELDNSFEIVTIVAGNSNTIVSKFAKDRGFNWPILKTGNDIFIFENYNIIAYPTYILINPDGTIGYAHLPMPEENMKLYLSRFMDVYNNK